VKNRTQTKGFLGDIVRTLLGGGTGNTGSQG
jgi:hypothetical protein